MSISTVDLKAVKALSDWEKLVASLTRDSGAFSTFPRGMRDANLADALSAVLVRCASFKRSRDRYYWQCELRRMALSYITNGGYDSAVSWKFPSDYGDAMLKLFDAWHKRPAV